MQNTTQSIEVIVINVSTTQSINTISKLVPNERSRNEAGSSHAAERQPSKRVLFCAFVTGVDVSCSILTSCECADIDRLCHNIFSLCHNTAVLWQWHYASSQWMIINCFIYIIHLCVCVWFLRIFEYARAFILNHILLCIFCIYMILLKMNMCARVCLPFPMFQIDRWIKKCILS